MGCKSKYRDNEAFGLQEGCSSVSQGRALEPAGDRRSREMTVAPQGEQNPAYSSGSLINKKFRLARDFFVLFYTASNTSSCAVKILKNMVKGYTVA